MTVKTLLSVANDWDFVSIEDDDYGVFAEGEVSEVRRKKGVEGLNVVCFYTGNRNNMYCTVVIAEIKHK